MSFKSAILAVAALITLMTPCARAADAEALAWPAATRESRPWTRWWWLGSAVDEGNLTRLLEQYRAAGLGGVEICPIYGAKGAEARYRVFLSEPWLAALAHTTREAERLDIGVDLTTGTGWPFGGRDVGDGDASTSFSLRHLGAGAYEIATRSPVQKVKRAAPGGEGNVLDPYSAVALTDYLARFSDAFRRLDGPLPRGHFHDSFEYFSANWTGTFPAEFRRLRGYELGDHLAALAGEGDGQTAGRVRHDYRQTLSDLHLGFLRTYSDWAHSHGGVARNQAHGSPTNLLDAYAVADIPETETFGPASEQSLVFLKFASSAAHLAGRRLASAEAFTWLGEHFQTSLADCKPAADLLFAAGINHLVFHGTPYSPEDAGFPGWLFYASVHFGPHGGLFRDLPAFTAYLTRVQSVLQSGKPDADVLLYFPHHEIWQTATWDKRDPMVSFRLHNVAEWLTPTPFHKAATDLLARGYSVDFVSDELLSRAVCEAGRIRVGGNAYRAVLVPPVKVMDPKTAQKLVELSKAGARVGWMGELPAEVPGLAKVGERRGELRAALAQLRAGDDALADVPRETLVERGLRFVRRTHARGHHYFLANRTDKAFEGWLPIAAPAAGVVLLDPLAEDRNGVAAVRRRGEGGRVEVYVQLPAGGSVIVRTFASVRPAGAAWRYLAPAEGAVAIEGPWQVTFVEGGPELPKAHVADSLASWTDWPDPEAGRFAGTARYSTTFRAPGGDQGTDYVLDLGRVCETARVTLNGRALPTLWCAPYSLAVGKYLSRSGENQLTVEVTNLAANRIADLDRRKVAWKSFHEINFVNRSYKPFDASGWPPRASGLLGPVRLVPMRQFRPEEEP